MNLVDNVANGKFYDDQFLSLEIIYSGIKGDKGDSIIAISLHQYFKKYIKQWMLCMFTTLSFLWKIKNYF